MAEALKDLPGQPRPSEASFPGLLDGFNNINRLVYAYLGDSDDVGPVKPPVRLVKS